MKYKIWVEFNYYANQFNVPENCFLESPNGEVQVFLTEDDAMQKAKSLNEKMVELNHGESSPPHYSVRGIERPIKIEEYVDELAEESFYVEAGHPSYSVNENG
tara:strand:+ start:1009 stop:1317 length:309 start_codon:yes stop_codon:yes gene_type:complete